MKVNKTIFSPGKSRAGNKENHFDIQRTVHRDIILAIKANEMLNFSN